MAYNWIAVPLKLYGIMQQSGLYEGAEAKSTCPPTLLPPSFRHMHLCQCPWLRLVSVVYPLVVPILSLWFVGLAGYCQTMSMIDLMLVTVYTHYAVNMKPLMKFCCFKDWRRADYCSLYIHACADLMNSTNSW